MERTASFFPHEKHSQLDDMDLWCVFAEIITLKRPATVKRLRDMRWWPSLFDQGTLCLGVAGEANNCQRLEFRCYGWLRAWLLCIMADNITISTLSGFCGKNGARCVKIKRREAFSQTRATKESECITSSVKWQCFRELLWCLFYSSEGEKKSEINWCVAYVLCISRREADHTHAGI